jgi:hypothetical protein
MKSRIAILPVAALQLLVAVGAFASPTFNQPLQGHVIDNGDGTLTIQGPSYLRAGHGTLPILAETDYQAQRETASGICALLGRKTVVDSEKERLFVHEEGYAARIDASGAYLGLLSSRKANEGLDYDHLFFQYRFVDCR